MAEKACEHHAVGMYGSSCICLFCREVVDLVEWLRVREERDTEIRLEIPKGKLN